MPPPIKEKECCPQHLGQNNAEDQLRTLNKNQSNRGTTSIEQFENLVRETNAHRDKPSTESQGARKDRHHPQTRAETHDSHRHQSKSQFQSAESTKTRHLVDQNQTNHSQVAPKLFQSTPQMANSMRASPTPTPTNPTPAAKSQPNQQAGKTSTLPQGTQAEVLSNTNANANTNANLSTSPNSRVALGATAGHPSATQAATGKNLATTQHTSQRAIQGKPLPGTQGQASVKGGLIQAKPLAATQGQGTIKTLAGAQAQNLAMGTSRPLANGSTQKGVFAGNFLATQTIGFGARAQAHLPNLNLKNPAKTRGLPAVPSQIPLAAAPMMGLVGNWRGPSMLQRVENSLLQFSSLLFGNYFKNLPQGKISGHELMLQQLALMMAAEEKRKKEKKSLTKNKNTSQVEKKFQHPSTHSNEEEEEWMEHLCLMIDLMNRYRQENIS